MPRARIVLETSNQRKSAMIEAASLQGATLVDWIEDHIATANPCLSSGGAEPVNEIDGVGELEDAKSTFEALSCRDWSFTEGDTRYLTHDLHPYPAKFIPQIPANLIARLSMRGDVVLDPFGGSATTAVEAVRLGRRAISFDANPLAAVIGRVKTGFMTPSVHVDLGQLSAAVEGHLMGSNAQRCFWSKPPVTRCERPPPPIPNIEKWFEKHVTEELCLLRHLIDQTTEGLARDAAQLALSRIIIRVSNQESETRYVSVAKKVCPSLTLRAYLESLKTVTRRLETASLDLQFADASFLVGDSRSELTGTIGENSVDLIVTSPPYPNATDYHLYHRFRLFWLGFDPTGTGPNGNRITPAAPTEQHGIRGVPTRHEARARKLCRRPGPGSICGAGRRRCVVQGRVLLDERFHPHYLERRRLGGSRHNRSTGPPDQALVCETGETYAIRAACRVEKTESSRKGVSVSPDVQDVEL